MYFYWAKLTLLPGKDKFSGWVLNRLRVGKNVGWTSGLWEDKGVVLLR
jgi:hypothetical protein